MEGNGSRHRHRFDRNPYTGKSAPSELTGGSNSPHRWIARPTLISLGAGKANHHRRLSVVRRLGAGHIYRDPRPLYRERSTGGCARYSCGMGRRRLGRECCQIVFPIKAMQPDSIPVDASLWYMIAVGDYLLAVGKAFRS